MQLTKTALGKFQFWTKGGVYAQLEGMPEHEVMRGALAGLHQRLKAKPFSSFPSVVTCVPVLPGVRAAAWELCKELGLLVKSVDETNEEGEPPLVAAVASGNVWALELLMAAGCEVGSASEEDGWTALHRASLLGHRVSVSCLLEAGANVRATNKLGETSLSVAAEAGQSEVVEYLLKKGGGKELLMRTDQIAQQGNVKYATEAKFGKMEDFTRTLVDKIGLPDHRLCEAQPYTLHPSPFTLHPKHNTLHPAS